MDSITESASGSEDLEERVSRLCERFPAVSAEKVQQILRDHGGHAGYAASELRALSTDAVKPVDPEDSEHVATLLSNHTLFKQTCRAHFKKFDLNGNGTLEWEEVLALTNHLCSYLGVEKPTERSLKAFFDGSDTNEDGVLAEKEFPKFFESFLRYAFFMQHRQLVGTWRIRSSESSSSSSSEFTIVQGKDYRLYYRSARASSSWSLPLSTRQDEVPRGQEWLHGNLELHEGFLHADLKVSVLDSEKQGPVSRGSYAGTVRLRAAEGKSDRVLLNFRREAEGPWGNDIKASRRKENEMDRFEQYGIKAATMKECHHRLSPPSTRSGVSNWSATSGT